MEKHTLELPSPATFHFISCGCAAFGLSDAFVVWLLIGYTSHFKLLICVDERKRETITQLVYRLNNLCNKIANTILIVILFIIYFIIIFRVRLVVYFRSFLHWRHSRFTAAICIKAQHSISKRIHQELKISEKKVFVEWKALLSIAYVDTITRAEMLDRKSAQWKSINTC